MKILAFMKIIQMNKVLLKSFAFFVLATITLSPFKAAQAQYEQKLTVHGSGAFILPNVYYLEVDESGDPESYFSFGLGADGGLQFNPNRFVSLMGNARYYYILPNSDYNEAYYQNLAFGAGIKLNIAGRKRINPYLFGEANFNILFYENYFEYPEGRGVHKVHDEYSNASLGGSIGLGFDIRFNDHFGIFLQSSGYYTHYDEFINLYNQVGIRISLIKARTI